MKAVRRACIDLLDLSYDQNDINEIENDGILSLERDYAVGVVEAISFLSELLGYTSLPKIVHLRHHEMFGKYLKEANGGYRLGPVVMYSNVDGALKLITGELTGAGGKIAEMLAAFSSGKEKASEEGPDVFRSLARSVQIRPLWPEAASLF